ncbi:MAG: hypothetical protein ACHQPI_05905 [Thermoanaerobaculia bacterium]
MSDDRKRVLEMLASGKVTVDEAERLLTALGDAPSDGPDGAAASVRPQRYFRISVRKTAKEGPGKNVDIRIPLSLVKGGMRLGAMIPGCGEAVTEQLKKQGINLDVTKLDPEHLESALRDLGEMEVDDGNSHVRISYE